ncbi:preprotein translocase subunit YajC [Desulfovibrio sp. OttesenSCG-928-C06]|nr:preprotein translocase subunit YajC [Desulfovibrio sp. OttesenSCG-928-C06]
MFSSIAHAMGVAPQGGAEGGTAAMLSSFMPIVLIIVVFYFLLIRPQQKRAKQHREMLQSLKKGDSVVTSAGIYGRIAEFDGDNVVVDTGEVKFYMLRSALNVLPANQKNPVPLKKGKKKEVVEEVQDDNEE